MFGSNKDVRRSVEDTINRLYKAFKPSADKYRYTFSLPELTVGGLPTVIFLGNHSSGKSTLINYLLGGSPVQDTGVAPTDDGFTIILYGDKDEDFYGPAALGRLTKEFANLGKFGPEFLQHLHVKYRKSDFLKKVNLIDSPGMIDSAGGSSTRNYNFAAVVRSFVELSNIVFFMFDPDKPGTTGETVDVLSKCLFGMEFKLRVIMNKCDTFENMYDFARSYGTLCWNLSRVLKSKDLPKIYTTFTPNEGTRVSTQIDLNWFEKHRAELLNLIHTAQDRKIDSVIAAAAADFTQLYIRVFVLIAASQKLLLGRIKGWSMTTLSVLIIFLLETWVFSVKTGQSIFGPFSLGHFLFWLTAVVTIGFTFFLGALFIFYAQKKSRAQIVIGIEKIFETSFAESLSYGDRGDLRQYWSVIKPETISIIKNTKHLPIFSWGLKRRLERVVYLQLKEVMEKLRRNAQK
jgi:GTPase SAR1 family protein